MTDVRDLTREAMLDDYVQRSAAKGAALEATTLRTQSAAMLDVFAHGASGGTKTASEVERLVRSGESHDLDPLWLAKMARVEVFVKGEEVDVEFSIKALRYSLEKLQLKTNTRRFYQLYAELLIQRGDFSGARDFLNKYSQLKSTFYSYLAKERQNPFRNPKAKNVELWLHGYNSPFRARKMRGISLKGSEEKAFNRLFAPETLGPAAPGPLVSVIMTTYCPNREAVLLSARSILAQSWANLELIVVDDASPADYSSVLKEIQALDSRVRVVIQPENGGTYLARNRGLREARGELVTGQDDDDWSHPDRILSSVRFLQSRPEVPGVVTFAIRSGENLERVFVGKPPFAEAAITLMAYTHSLRELGGYLPARRGADNELRHRLSAYAGVSVGTLEDPLMLVRIQEGSLSRSDFRGSGWAHPARRAFQNSYALWHKQADKSELRLEHGDMPVPIPSRFQVVPPASRTFDVVFIGDWRDYGGPQISMMNEIKALRRQGLRIAVMTFEALRFMGSKVRPLCEPIQQFINRGEVEQLLPDDEAKVRLAILRYPPILQFPPEETVVAEIERLIIVANQAPSERDGRDIRYIPRECADNAERLFGRRATWVPQGPSARESLVGRLDEQEVAEFDMPGIIDTKEWSTDRSYFRGDPPIIGRHSRDHAMKWPDNIWDIAELYPGHGQYEVRILGGAKVVRNFTNGAEYPANWVVYETNEVPVKDFLDSLDFYIYFDNPSSREAFGRAILEALASGCVTIIPPHFESTFGEAALYADPTQVRGLIRELHAAPERFREQSVKAVRHVNRVFSYEAYWDRVSKLLDSVPVQVGVRTGNS